MHHCTIQINHQPDATIFQFIILTFVYSSTCFGCFPAHHQELNDCSDSLWFYLRIVVIAVLCSWSLWCCDPTRVMASSFLRFPDHTQRRTTVGRAPLDEWSACRRDLYLTTHNTHNRQTSMPPVGFEPTISAGKRPQTYALDRAATGTGIYIHIHIHISLYHR